jgi:hypothetical protein
MNDEELRKLIQGRLDKREAANMNRSMGDMAVAALPSITNFLVGGTYADQAKRTQQASDYLKKRGDNEEITKAKLSAIKNEAGDPEFIDSEDAVGMQPYLDKKGASSESGDDIFATKDVFDPETGNAIIHGVTRSGKVVNLGLVKDRGVGQTTATLPGGQKTYDQYQKNDPNMKKHIKGYKGSADVYGVDTVGQAKTIEKQAGEGSKALANISIAKGMIDSSKSELERSPDYRVLSSTIYRLARASEMKDRLTQQDFDQLTGGLREPTIEQIAYFIEKKFGANNLNGTRKSYIALVDSIKKRLEREEEGVKKAYTPNGNKKASEGFDKVAPEGNIKAKNRSLQNKAKFIDIENKAKKHFKDKDILNQYLDMKARELGINRNE